MIIIDISICVESRKKEKKISTSKKKESKIKIWGFQRGFPFGRSFGRSGSMRQIARLVAICQRPSDSEWVFLSLI